MSGFAKAGAFIRRDFIDVTSYRLNFVMMIVRMFLTVVVFYYLAAAMGKGVDLESLKPYGGDYFAFLLVGIAFSSSLNLALNSFSSNIQDAQVKGTLEALLVTPTSAYLVILASSLWGFIFSMFRVILYVVIGVLFFGVDMSGGNVGGAFLVLLLMSFSFSGVGILSASFVMVLKRGNPINWIFGWGSWVLGGVFFPIEVFDSPWLQWLARILPITHALDATRRMLFGGESLMDTAPQWLYLVAFSAVVLPLSGLALYKSVRMAKRHGSLIQY